MLWSKSYLMKLAFWRACASTNLRFDRAVFQRSRVSANVCLDDITFRANLRFDEIAVRRSCFSTTLRFVEAAFWRSRRFDGLSLRTNFRSKELSSARACNSTKLSRRSKFRVNELFFRRSHVLTNLGFLIAKFSRELTLLTDLLSGDRAALPDHALSEVAFQPTKFRRTCVLTNIAFRRILRCRRTCGSTNFQHIRTLLIECLFLLDRRPLDTISFHHQSNV